MASAVEPPIDPMLAKAAEHIPAEDGFLFGPNWDGFRAIVFRGEDDVFIQSRDRDFALEHVSLSPDAGTVRLWDARQGQPLSGSLRHPDVVHAAFSAAATLLATTGSSVRVWPLADLDAPSDEVLGLEARLLAARRIDDTGGVVPLDAPRFRAEWTSARVRRTGRVTPGPGEERRPLRGRGADFASRCRGPAPPSRQSNLMVTGWPE